MSTNKLIDEWADAACVRFVNRSSGEYTTNTVSRYDLQQLIDAAVARERERAALVCDDEARIRTEAGNTHPEDSESRGRCFAAARAAINCAKGVRNGENVPLYLAAGAQAKPLTDAQIRRACTGWFDVDGKSVHARYQTTNITERIIGLVRAIEKAHKIGGSV